jgi:hypothetical protein
MVMPPVLPPLQIQRKRERGEGAAAVAHTPTRERGKRRRQKVPKSTRRTRRRARVKVKAKKGAGKTKKINAYRPKVTWRFLFVCVLLSSPFLSSTFLAIYNLHTHLFLYILFA